MSGQWQADDAHVLQARLLIEMRVQLTTGAQSTEGRTAGSRMTRRSCRYASLKPSSFSGSPSSSLSDPADQQMAYPFREVANQPEKAGVPPALFSSSSFSGSHLSLLSDSVQWKPERCWSWRLWQSEMRCTGSCWYAFTVIHVLVDHNACSSAPAGALKLTSCFNAATASVTNRYVQPQKRR